MSWRGLLELLGVIPGSAPTVINPTRDGECLVLRTSAVNTTVQRTPAGDAEVDRTVSV